MKLINLMFLFLFKPCALEAFKGGHDSMFGFIQPNNVLEIFQRWMVQHSVLYADLSTTWRRFQIFKTNVQRAFDLNEKHGGLTTFGLTQFADLTPQEFLKNQLIPGIAKLFNASSQRIFPRSRKSRTELVSEIDWTKKGVVPPVRNQGKVGTCYIFSTLDMISSRWAMKGNPAVNLSVEQVADCLAVAPDLFSDSLACGINGGLPYAVFRYIKKVGGVTTEEMYPYCVGSGTCKPCAPPGYDPEMCERYPLNDCDKADSCPAKLDTSQFVQGLMVSTWTDVIPEEETIAHVLETEGPLTCAVDASDLQLYKSGILVPDRCRPYDLNHACLLVGYGVDRNVSYWKVKNSWGRQFGEDGYYRIARGIGACGIHRYVSTVTLE
nr:cathepsin L1-like [Biomphalaria glabrata]